MSKIKLIKEDLEQCLRVIVKFLGTETEVISLTKDCESNKYILVYAPNREKNGTTNT